MAKMKIEPQDRPKVKAQCLRLMVTLKLNPAKMQLISGFIDCFSFISLEIGCEVLVPPVTILLYSNLHLFLTNEYHTLLHTEPIFLFVVK